MKTHLAAALAAALILAPAVSTPASAAGSYVVVKGQNGLCVITTVGSRTFAKLQSDPRFGAWTVVGPSLRQARDTARLQSCRTLKEVN
jgi:hypothetical protein